MVVELACTCDGLPSHSHTYEERPDDLACCGGLEGVGHVPGCPVLDYVTSTYRIVDPAAAIRIAGT